MKFSRYGTPFFTRFEQDLLLRQRDQLRVEAVVRRETARLLKNAVMRSGECMNMMKSASTRGISSTR